jgi:hypothetical protein
VFFKSSDGPFCGVAAVAVGRNQLELHVLRSEKVFQSSRCFVVESWKFWSETFGSEFLMNVIICLDPFRVGSGCHWENLDIVSVINIADHDVIVALAGSHRKFTRQVRVKLSLVDQDGVNKMGFFAQICVSGWNILNGCSDWCFLGGPNVLESLIHEPHSRGRRELQMFVDSFLC